MRITHDMYDKMIVDCKRKEAELLEELQGHSKADEAFLISSSYVLELANRAKELFEGSQAAQKNQLLRFVLANAIVNGEKLLPQLKTPFAGILLCNRNEDWLSDTDSIKTLLMDVSECERVEVLLKHIKIAIQYHYVRGMRITGIN